MSAADLSVCKCYFSCFLNYFDGASHKMSGIAEYCERIECGFNIMLEFVRHSRVCISIDLIPLSLSKKITSENKTNTKVVSI